jgi:dolichyl-phosphate beta-glucosyltransferase
MYLSVIIPAYNEEKRLPKTLEEIDKYLKKQSYDYEIMVVNDGSKDRTVEVAKNLIPKIKNLIVAGYEKNQGKGYAVRFGMQKAKGDYRLFTDADNSTSIAHLEKMWPEFKKGFEVVIGTRDPRDAKGARQAFPQSWGRRRLGDIFNLLVQIIVGIWGIWDSQCGFKGFTSRVAENIFSKCKINRFAFDPEILAIAKKLGYKIKVIPVTWINAPDSRVKFKWMINMGFDLLKIRWNLITGKYD